MHGTLFTPRHPMRASRLWQALLIVSAAGLLACDGTVIQPDPAWQQPQTWTTLGYYTVTITAAPSCSLPDYAMKGSYPAALLRQKGRDLAVLFDPYGPFVGSPGFTGTQDGWGYSDVTFTLNGEPSASGYSFIALVNGMEVAYTGIAQGRMSESGIRAAFQGTVQVTRDSDHASIARCDAVGHFLEMTR